MSKYALIVGGSADVWNEVRLAREICNFDRIYCIKMSGIHWPQGDFTWVTLHPEFMDDYEAQRRALGHPDGYEIVAPPPEEVGMHGKKGNITRRLSYRWPGMTSSAASGIYGAKVAMHDGYRAILAGVPMTPDAGHFLPETRNGAGLVRGKVWTQQSAFVNGMNEAIPHMQGHVKSMSGYTQKVLGAPTQEWLSC